MSRVIPALILVLGCSGPKGGDAPDTGSPPGSTPAAGSSTTTTPTGGTTGSPAGSSSGTPSGVGSGTGSGSPSGTATGIGSGTPSGVGSTPSGTPSGSTSGPTSPYAIGGSDSACYGLDEAACEAAVGCRPIVGELDPCVATPPAPGPPWELRYAGCRTEIYGDSCSDIYWCCADVADPGAVWMIPDTCIPDGWVSMACPDSLLVEPHTCP